MAKGSGNDRSLLRLIFWEALALAAFLYLKTHPLAAPLWALHFFYNALFFLVAYPLLYVYRWKVSEGCLNMVFWPLSFVLRWGLGVSAYLWTAYGFFVTGNPFFTAMEHHWIVLGVLFAFVYFPVIQPLWGISQRYYGLGLSIWIVVYSGLGGFLGFLLGQFAVRHWLSTLETNNQFLVWLGLILLGIALGALLARRRDEK